MKFRIFYDLNYEKIIFNKIMNKNIVLLKEYKYF